MFSHIRRNARQPAHVILLLVLLQQVGPSLIKPGHLDQAKKVEAPPILSRGCLTDREAPLTF
jgi:hypothetical protein